MTQFQSADNLHSRISSTYTRDAEHVRRAEERPQRVLRGRQAGHGDQNARDEAQCEDRALHDQRDWEDPGRFGVAGLLEARVVALGAAELEQDPRHPVAPEDIVCVHVCMYVCM